MYIFQNMKYKIRDGLSFTNFEYEGVFIEIKKRYYFISATYNSGSYLQTARAWCQSV